MARRILLHPPGAAQRLVRYLQSGRVLRQRMYAATPIPFLRRLHLIQEPPYFTGLSANLPTWWASDARFVPGFEFRTAFVDAVDEWAGDAVTTRTDLSDQSPDQPVRQSPDASTEAGSAARRGDVSGRDRSAAPMTVSVSDILPRRTFVRAVRLQDMARPTSMRRGSAAVSVTEVERPIVPQLTGDPEHTSSLPAPPVPPAERAPSVPTALGDHTHVQMTPAEPEPEHRSLNTEAAIAESAPNEPLRAIAMPPLATVDVRGEQAIADVSEAPPPVVGRSDSRVLTTDRTPTEEAAIGDAAADSPRAAVSEADPADDQRTVVAAAPAIHETSIHAEDSDRIAESPAVVPSPSRRRARVEELPTDRLTAGATDSRESTAAASNSRRVGPPSRPPAVPEPPREREGDRLFQPVDDGVDRSPAVWAARLARAMRPASAASPRTSAPRRAADSATAPTRRPVHPSVSGPTRRPSTPIPSAPPAPAPVSRSAASDTSEVTVSEKARRFLKPIVGIDPATVTIVQGPAADEINAANQTDALAVGDDTIVVGPGFTGELPRDLGLLAHELTHIARDRRPRFIPPAARSRTRGMSTGLDEEAVARRVEAQTIAFANDSAAQRTIADRVFHESRRQSAPELIAATPDGAQMPHASHPVDDWGGLPAPWEPLPEWVTAPTMAAESTTGMQRSFDTGPLSGAAPSVPMPVATSVPATQPAVHAADSARVLDAPGGAGTQAAGEGQPPVAPDIDHLARQVYAALKRRLEADARRERMFRG